MEKSDASDYRNLNANSVHYSQNIATFSNKNKKIVKNEEKKYNGLFEKFKGTVDSTLSYWLTSINIKKKLCVAFQTF